MRPVVWSPAGGCQACRLTLRELAKRGVAHEHRIASEEDRDRLLGEGHRAFPVVETAAESWSGFNLDKIKELAN